MVDIEGYIGFWGWVFFWLVGVIIVGVIEEGRGIRSCASFVFGVCGFVGIRVGDRNIKYEFKLSFFF